MRTYSRTDWETSRELWRSFDYRWNGLRERAALQGMIFPPSGTKHDDRDAENPSQRSIVWRALNDNPAELYAIVGRSHSWSGVVDRIIGLESRLREDADYAEQDAEWGRKERPDHRESVQALGSIITRLRDSA